MLSRSYCAGILGVEGYVITVEAEVGPGLPCLTIVGQVSGALCIKDKLLGGVPSGTAVLNRPARGDPAAFMQPLLPLDDSRLVDSGVLGGQPSLDLVVVCFGEKASNLVSEGDFLRSK